MADHNKPTSTSLAADFVTELDARLDDVAMMLDPAFTTVTNPPMNAVRWSSAANKFQKWNGSAWVDLSANYSFGTVTITGGSINGTPIGGTSRAAGNFTTVDASGNASVGGTVSAVGIGLSAISQSLHSGSIVKAIVYDTSKDSDGGAWRKRTMHTSWYNEALGFTGKWLGQKASTAAAWATSGAAAGDGFQNSTDGKFYALTGTSTASEIFRGNVREFPAVVAVVVESVRVIIYDLTQPACPMWMVFADAANYMVRLQSAGNSVACRDGLLCVGTSGGAGLNAVNFVRDGAFRYSTSSFNLQGTISQRNSALSGSSLGANIVHSTINDVAVTVLDTAPSDPATGLPVPTIAVATAGGVSVIKDDGTVVNSSATGNIRNVSVTKENRLAYFYIGGVGYGARVVPLAGIAAGFSGTSYTDIGIPASGLVNYGAVANSDLVQYGATVGFLVGGFSRIKENPSTPAKGMVDYITNTYNSGWMVGDIRGAWLADTTAETISASGELVANGDFSSSTGWTLPTGWSIAAGKLTYGGTGAANSNAAYTVATVAGRSYVATITLDSISAGSVLLRAYGASTVDHVVSAAGQLQVTFVASAPTTAIAIQNQTAGQTLQLDNISVKLAEPDRCVKNKGLIVNGSLTKTPVAAGAALVAWSGFSDSNYLEQPYNADLDFGTGDFCYMGWVNLSNITTVQSLFDRGGNSSGRISLAVSTSLWYASVSATSTAATHLGVAPTTGLSFVVFYRESGVLKLNVNGVQVYSVANTANVSNATAVQRIGQGYVLGSAMLGSMALWRISSTAPSADQIAHIYRTELPLFQAGAQCTLAGSSAAVTTMAYDEDTTLLHVGTSWGRSSFKDLTRIDSEATSTGALTSLSASGGVIVTGGTSGKVYMPALLLRDELRRKAEARKALGRVPVFFDFTATASQTAFVAPKGYTVKALYKNGTLMRETTTGVYWTRSNDGFQETATLSVGASASDWISLMCVRA